ncbi:MAG TPA: hypothetical protein VGG30_03330 [Pirellulales bacterium]|jgi:hypothetical protein
MKENKARVALGVATLMALASLGLGLYVEYCRPISERFAAMGVVGKHVRVINFSYPLDRARYTRYANACRRWQGDMPLAQEIWLPAGALSAAELQLVREAFPEATVRTYPKYLPSSAPFGGRAVFVFSDSLEAEGLDPSVRQKPDGEI